MAKKKKQDCPPPGSPSWMVTYGDLMSLLLCFFVILVSMSTMEKIKFQQAAGSLKGALGMIRSRPTVTLRPRSPAADVPVPRKTSRKNKKMIQKIQELIEYIKKNDKEGEMKVKMSKGGVGIRISDPNLFDLGKAVLKESSKPLLDKVIEALKVVDYPIRIEGHTDDLPISTREFPSNWELSSARALSILKYFQNSGKIDPIRLEAVGLGEYHPVTPNKDEKSRSVNRRVDIFVLTEDYREKIWEQKP